MNSTPHRHQPGRTKIERLRARLSFLERQLLVNHPNSVRLAQIKQRIHNEIEALHQAETIEAERKATRKATAPAATPVPAPAPSGIIEITRPVLISARCVEYPIDLRLECEQCAALARRVIAAGASHIETYAAAESTLKAAARVMVAIERGWVTHD